MLAVFLFASCKEEIKSQSVNPIPVEEMVVRAVDCAVGSRYSGTVETENETSLSFSLSGTIRQLPVKVGDRVRRGQLIASVDPATCRNAYDMARATRTQAEDAYGRMKQLYEKGSLPDINWVEAQSRLQQAIASENIAKKNLDDCNLYAPCDGIVSEKSGEVGQNAAPGMPVVKLVTTEVLNVVIPVPENEISRVGIRQGAEIEISALPGRRYAGRVVEKGVIADPVSRSYEVKVRVEDNDGALLPGMVATVVVDQPALEGAIVIPAALVQIGDDNSHFVWVNENGRAERRTVTCGTYQADGVTIVEGLREGEKVICGGRQKVCEGTVVVSK